MVTEELPAKVAANQSYQNALQHSDLQNARIEHDKALQDAINGMLADQTQLFKLFYDNDAFRQFLQDSTFKLTSTMPRGIDAAAAGDVAAVQALPDSTRKRLAELTALEADWDSYGAVPVSPQSLTMAEQIIQQMVTRFDARGVPTEVMPIADGGVQVEWHGRSGDLALNARARTARGATC